MIPDQVPQFVKTRSLQPLDDGLGGPVDDFLPGAISGAKYEGKLCIAPLYMTLTLPAYNKKVLAEIGVTEAPKTWDEVLSWVPKLSAKGYYTLDCTAATTTSLGGIDTYWGTIIPTVANVQAVFLMRQYVAGLPNELLEAARMDAASEWRTFTRIVLPLTRPALAALGVFIFIWHWNDFLWPLLVTQSAEMRTITVGLATLGSENLLPQQSLAVATITVLPCLLVFGLFQRYIADNIATVGLKG